MVYQQCGQACPQTCDTEESEDCVGGCVEGCFCPSGKVLWNGNCINSSECAGIQILCIIKDLFCVYDKLKNSTYIARYL